MKKFTIFGFKFLFDIKKKDSSDEERYSDSYFLKEKVFYLIYSKILTRSVERIFAACIDLCLGNF